MPGINRAFVWHLGRACGRIPALYTYTLAQDTDPDVSDIPVFYFSVCVCERERVVGQSQRAKTPKQVS